MPCACDRSLLCEPIEFGESPDLFVGRGSFGVVKCQTYRGISVAVKEFLPCTVKESVEREARLMLELCHPCFLVYALHIIILVVQYYGIEISKRVCS